MADQGDMQMKKMLVVNNHMAVGGVQKSLIGFLKDMQKEYDVSLLLLYPSGPLMQMIPAGVHVLGTASLFRYFGMSQSDCRRVSDRAIRASLVLLARFLGTDAVVRLAAKGMDSFGVFDEIVSFHHPGRDKTIYGGTADYALCYAKRHGGKTSCYVHCDYSHSGLNDPRSKRLYRRFDQIVCVSEGTRGSFLQAFAEDKDTIRDEIAAKTVIRYNSLDAESIQKKAEEGGVPACWAEQTCLKLLSVARLSKEKGILRMVKLFAGMNLPPYRYVILGDGEEKQRIIQEFVPGRQITLLHVIAQPVDDVYDKLGVPHDGAVGILTITPGESAIIAGDIATKAGEVRIGFLDRFTGALTITGDVASVTSSMRAISDYFENILGYAPSPLTKS